MENTGHCGMRRGHQISRDHLRYRIAAQLLARRAYPELRRNYSVVPHVFALLLEEIPMRAISEPPRDFSLPQQESFAGCSCTNCYA